MHSDPDGLIEQFRDSCHELIRHLDPAIRQGAHQLTPWIHRWEPPRPRPATTLDYLGLDFINFRDYTFADPAARGHSLRFS
jgi:hypothetical protein